jgi:hypothetical protein
MARLPDTVRNRKGCFIILAILVLFVALYIFVGIRAGPGNNVAEDIQTVPSH